LRGAEHSEGSNGAVNGTLGVGILSVRRHRGGELDWGGAGHGHAVHMGVPVYGVYVAWG
jgi:hypothetical protein